MAGGTDSLTDVEVLQGTDGNILLVGNGGFATIQEAIDAAVDGDTIMVAAGTYQEQIVIDGKDVTLEGAGIGETIILSPDAADLELSHVETNSGSPNRYSVVTITNDADVTIEGVTVDGNDQGAIPHQRLQFQRHLRDQLRRHNRRRRGDQYPRGGRSTKCPATSATTQSSPPATMAPTAATDRIRDHRELGHQRLPEDRHLCQRPER